MAAIGAGQGPFVALALGLGLRPHPPRAWASSLGTVLMMSSNDLIGR